MKIDNFGVTPLTEKEKKVTNGGLILAAAVFWILAQGYRDGRADR